MRLDAIFGLLKTQVAYGEADPDDLPSELNDLLHVRSLLIELGQALRAVRQVCDEKVGATLEPGQKYEYGDSVVSFYQGYKWKPIPDAAEKFVTDVAVLHPDAVTVLFNLNSIRKTGVEKLAVRMGFDPEVMVETVLEKVWDKTPQVKVKPKEL